MKLDLDAHKALEAHRLSLEESQLDILKRVLSHALPPDTQASRKAGPASNNVGPLEAPAETAPAEGERRTGHFLVQLGPQAQYAASQKQAYLLALRLLISEHSDLLDALAGGKSRGRKIVARRPEALYPKAPHLAPLAEPLVKGWFVDLNLSKQQKISRLKTACRLAGLQYGSDLIVDF